MDQHQLLPQNFSLQRCRGIRTQVWGGKGSHVGMYLRRQVATLDLQMAGFARNIQAWLFHADVTFCSNLEVQI